MKNDLYELTDEFLSRKIPEYNDLSPQGKQILITTFLTEITKRTLIKLKEKTSNENK